MTTIKSYTDLSQSKTLSKILPLESADMCYIKHSSSNNSTWRFDNDMPPMVLHNTPINKMTVETLPCWTLAALLDVLPTIAKGKENANPFIVKASDNEYYVVYATFTEEIDSSAIYDNPVDACVAMIECLHELKML